MPYRWVVVAMLWCISFFNYADRQAIFSVFPLLEKELGLSMVQLGLLGSAFAWVYGLSGFFAGFVVDRVSRKKAILGGLYAWSIICMSTAWTRGFNSLFALRAAEGLGETIYYPAAVSLVSDYHGKKTRSRALGIHQTSVYGGTIAGGFFAGLIGQHYGWRWSFIVFGGLGVLLGFVLTRFLREPKRGQADLGEGESTSASLTLAQFFKLLGNTPTMLCLMGAFICSNFRAVVLLTWMPKFLFDKFQMSLAVAGLTANDFRAIGERGGFDRRRLAGGLFPHENAAWKNTRAGDGSVVRRAVCRLVRDDAVGDVAGDRAHAVGILQRDVRRKYFRVDVRCGEAGGSRHGRGISELRRLAGRRRIGAGGDWIYRPGQRIKRGNHLGIGRIFNGVCVAADRGGVFR